MTLLDDRLWDYAFLHVTGHGDIPFSDAEVDRLRQYLLRGGFLHVSDNYGLDANFRREIARVFPDRPLVDVPLTHPIYHLVYDFPNGVPKIHEHDGKPARGLGVLHWRPISRCTTTSPPIWATGGRTPARTTIHPNSTEAALRMGVNLFVYAITSRPTA